MINTKSAKDIQCPVCGYYCNGKGGIGCIDKPELVRLEGFTPPKSWTPDSNIKQTAELVEKLDLPDYTEDLKE